MDRLAAPDYWLAQVLLQRGLAVIYLIAFLVALNQFRPLLGEHGLLPAPRFLARVSFRQAPSLFHWHYSDRTLAGVSWLGISLSGLLVAGIPQTAPLWVSMLTWLLLWMLYQSIVNVGQVFYGFGWESLLLEAGFLAIFLGNDVVAPPVVIIWAFRWLLFRLEVGAGLIKMRGDSCWRDLTCLYYHHETQPMPNPLSWFFHHLPKPLHRVEVAANHFAQLVAPFGLFLPQPIASVAGAIIAVTQGWLLLSGNFSWLNLIAIVLAASALDASALEAVLGAPTPASLEPSPAWHAAIVLAAFAGIVYLSYWPLRNLLSRRQLMNFSFNRVHLVNTYGAFGSITRVRNEVVIEGTDEEVLNRATPWREYEFKGKPGDPGRRPRQFAPYHLRLDWLMWFVALSPQYAEGWLSQLLARLLTNDASTLRLLRSNPFPDTPPRYVRARLYRYRFTTPAERRDSGAWWVRTLVGEYLPPVALDVERPRPVAS